jgi:hypothetical protein
VKFVGYYVTSKQAGDGCLYIISLEVRNCLLGCTAV